MNNVPFIPLFWTRKLYRNIKRRNIILKKSIIAEKSVLIKNFLFLVVCPTFLFYGNGMEKNIHLNKNGKYFFQRLFIKKKLFRSFNFLFITSRSIFFLLLFKEDKQNEYTLYRILENKFVLFLYAHHIKFNFLFLLSCTYRTCTKLFHYKTRKRLRKVGKSA